MLDAPDVWLAPICNRLIICFLQAAPAIAEGLMSVLASQSTNSTDVAYIVLMLDDLIQGGLAPALHSLSQDIR